LTHIRALDQYLFPVDANAVRLQDNLVAVSPTPGSTLIRTRLFIQFRILNYLTTGAATLETQWWQDTTPYFGMLVTDTAHPPLLVDEPIGGLMSNEWVIWGQGIGSLDVIGPEPIFTPSYYVTYKWQPEGGLSESFARRKTTAGNSPQMWLSWNWLDRHNVINTAHGTGAIAYDLAVNWSVDTVWELP
jgi:hypothetical protein